MREKRRRCLLYNAACEAACGIFEIHAETSKNSLLPDGIHRCQMIWQAVPQRKELTRPPRSEVRISPSSHKAHLPNHVYSKTPDYASRAAAFGDGAFCRRACRPSTFPVRSPHLSRQIFINFLVAPSPSSTTGAASSMVYGRAI
jgi:hypothetical protein